MESKETLIELDANISKFRRRNNMIIMLFLVLIISSALIIAALILELVRLHNAPRNPVAIPPIQAFCSLSDTDSCLKTLNPLIKNKFISDPNQIFTIALQTAAYDLQRIILSNLSDPDSPEFACSNSLRHGLTQIRDPLVKMRVNPFVESLSGEQRGEMKRRIEAAKGDVMSCLVVRKTAAAGAATEMLIEAKVCLDAAADFISGGGAGVLLRVYAVEVYGFERGMVYENVFGIGMCGLQLLFMFGMFGALYRIR